MLKKICIDTTINVGLGTQYIFDKYFIHTHTYIHNTTHVLVSVNLWGAGYSVRPCPQKVTV